ncbi:MAG: sodium:proton antiporter [Planctomycetes bacterium]|nr:sodium:proton antiporter [Planctomycetota bacterium]
MLLAAVVLSACLATYGFPAAAEDHDPQTKAAAADVHVEHDPHAAGHGPKLGELVHPTSLAPFAVLLLCIALFPLANPHWWEHNQNKGYIAAALGVPVVFYLMTFGNVGLHALEHAGKEYISFLLLLGSLFVISGGVYVHGSLKGSPLVNSIFLGLGGAVASFVGTTGASMLLIRPLLRANEKRKRVAHVVVFFIFIVSNCGGLLTPLGDPPLFLGFLKGVPFEWTLRLWPHWLTVNGLLLAVFYVWDTMAIHREAHTPEEEEALETPVSPEKFGLSGLHNFLGLGGIVAVIYCSGQYKWSFGVPEGLMLAISMICYWMTTREIREKNRFGFGPIIEVAVLFAGIFATMIPALAILNVQGKNLGIETPAQFFWASGILSSFLDNAPTYLTFAVTACGIHGVSDEGHYLAEFLKLPAASGAAHILAAISCGSVFMGANTYIGNGPNFMVKAIAEENNVRMPGFFGYMVYSGAILVPILLVVTVIFFR